MRKIIGIFIAVFLCPILYADQLTKPVIKSSLAVKSMLFDIVNVDEQFLVAVGERGHIIRTDNLKNWQQVDVPTQSTLTAVTFVNSMLGWAVGHNAIILNTQDGGLTWQIQQFLPELQKPLLDISFKNEKEGIAVGAYGLFYRTIDGGLSWVQEIHTTLLKEEDLAYLEELRQEDEENYLKERTSILPHFNRIFIDDDVVYLVGEVGLIAQSENFGRLWQRFEDVYQGSFFDISRTKQGSLLAIGLRGNSFRKAAKSNSWLKSSISITPLLNSVVIAGDSQIFLLGNNGVLLESNDDGKTFALRAQNDGKALLAGAVFKNELVIASEVGIKVLKVIK